MTKETTPEHNSFMAKFFDREYLENFLSFFCLGNRELSDLYRISAGLIENWKNKTDRKELEKEYEEARAEEIRAEKNFDLFAVSMMERAEEDRKRLEKRKARLQLEAEKARMEYQDFIEKAGKRAKEAMADKDPRDDKRWGACLLYGVWGNPPEDIRSEYMARKKRLDTAMDDCSNACRMKNWGVEKDRYRRFTLSVFAPDDVRAKWKEMENSVEEAGKAHGEARGRMIIYSSVDSRVSAMNKEAEKLCEKAPADVEIKADGVWDVRIRYGDESWYSYISVTDDSKSRKPSHGITFLCELKPVLGDDFPVVIEQLKKRIKNRLGHRNRAGIYVEPEPWDSAIWNGANWEPDPWRRNHECETVVLLIYRKFRASGVSEADMKEMFRSAGICAISEAEYLNTHKYISSYTYSDNRRFDGPRPFSTTFTLTDGVTRSDPAEDTDSTPETEYDYRAVFRKERALGRFLTDSELQEFIVTE